MGSFDGSEGKESACHAGDLCSSPSSGRSPGGGNGKPTPVLLPGEAHGQRSLAGYSPWGRKELHMTERLTLIKYWLGQKVRLGLSSGKTQMNFLANPILANFLCEDVHWKNAWMQNWADVLHISELISGCFILEELEKEREIFIRCELCAWHRAQGFFTCAILFTLTTIL